MTIPDDIKVLNLEPQNMKDIFQDIKKTIDVITLFEIRKDKLKEELNFFRNEINNPMHIGALLRLNHEAMYLCVDTYSLHQGISKKKSLYSQIKNHGSQLSKVDKSENHDADSIIYLEDFTSPGKREATHEEKIELTKEINQESILARQSLKEKSGILSSKHSDLDQWLETIQDNESEHRLSQFRKEFAHRLDSLDNIGRELDFPGYEDLDQRLEVVSTVLENYKRALQDILVYTTSTHYPGFGGISYDSISRIQQYVELESLTELGRKALDLGQEPLHESDNAWDVLESLTGTIAAPADWSKEHDHYLYGTPKQSEPNS